ncbi:MAG: helix-turn-helix domain-containing protein [Clostridium sp.]|nr:helix-turn-helix domain-containing protein [Clostridium sp.]MCM1209051.1 helix-turn-helix domain-containing protein [Ruminococcus sp.]
MYDKIECAKRLKSLREAAKKTQQEVAQDLNISVDTLRKLEQGKRMPSAWIIDILGNYYKITTDYIISGKNEIQIQNLERPNSTSSDKKVILERIMVDLKRLVE